MSEVIAAAFAAHRSPGICWILMTTNSAGFSGAKPTSMLTMPCWRSSWVVVSAPHLTKQASLGPQRWGWRWASHERRLTLVLQAERWRLTLGGDRPGSGVHSQELGLAWMQAF